MAAAISGRVIIPSSSTNRESDRCRWNGCRLQGEAGVLDRPVAIKILPPELAQDHQFVMRFEREARTLAKLQHSGDCSALDSGQTSAGHSLLRHGVRGGNRSGENSPRE